MESRFTSVVSVRTEKFLVDGAEYLPLKVESIIKLMEHFSLKIEHTEHAFGGLAIEMCHVLGIPIDMTNNILILYWVMRCFHSACLEYVSHYRAYADTMEVIRKRMTFTPTFGPVGDEVIDVLDYTRRMYQDAAKVIVAYEANLPSISEMRANMIETFAKCFTSHLEYLNTFKERDVNECIATMLRAERTRADISYDLKELITTVQIQLKEVARIEQGIADDRKHLVDQCSTFMLRARKLKSEILVFVPVFRDVSLAFFKSGGVEVDLDDFRAKIEPLSCGLTDLIASMNDYLWEMAKKYPTSDGADVGFPLITLCTS